MSSQLVSLQDNACAKGKKAFVVDRNIASSFIQGHVFSLALKAYTQQYNIFNGLDIQPLHNK